jgi:hypothetical protein
VSHTLAPGDAGPASEDRFCTDDVSILAHGNDAWPTIHPGDVSLFAPYVSADTRDRKDERLGREPSPRRVRSRAAICGLSVCACPGARLYRGRTDPEGPA